MQPVLLIAEDDELKIARINATGSLERCTVEAWDHPDSTEEHDDNLGFMPTEGLVIGTHPRGQRLLPGGDAFAIPALPDLPDDYRGMWPTITVGGRASLGFSDGPQWLCDGFEWKSYEQDPDIGIWDCTWIDNGWVACGAKRSTETPIAFDPTTGRELAIPWRKDKPGYGGIITTMALTTTRPVFITHDGDGEVDKFHIHIPFEDTWLMKYVGKAHASEVLDTDGLLPAVLFTNGKWLEPVAGRLETIEPLAVSKAARALGVGAEGHDNHWDFAATANGIVTALVQVNSHTDGYLGDALLQAPHGNPLEVVEFFGKDGIEFLDVQVADAEGFDWSC